MHGPARPVASPLPSAISHGKGEVLDKGSKRYLFAGGGTGGHVTPNIAVLRALREHEPDCDVRYVGTLGGPERRLVEPHDVPFHAVPARAFAHPRRVFAFLRFSLALALGTLRSLMILARYRPHVVVATGGYASAPPVLAAALLRRPIYLHEQNVKPGKANRFLARFATRVGLSFEETAEWFPAAKTVLTGYPVRKRIGRSDAAAARERLAIGKNQRVAFVLGGSMGSRSINRAMVDGLGRLLQSGEVTVIHSTGLKDNGGYNAWSDTNERLRASALPDGCRDRYILRRYIEHIEDAYAASDLVVTRAGAGVVMELAALGKPALLIPKSDGADDHQLVNAISLKNRGSADVLMEEIYDDDEGAITRVHGDQLARKINDLLSDSERLREMSRAAQNLAVPEAAENICTQVREIARSRRAASTSVQTLVGVLHDGEGREHELIFPTTGLSRSRLAEISLPGAGRAKAIIRRSGSTREETRFRLHVLRGPVLVEDRQVIGDVRLTPGQVIRVGGSALTFNAHIRTEVRPLGHSMLSSVLATGAGTLASRLSGLVRHVVLATSFATGAAADIFAASLTAANLFRRIFAENAVDSALLPTFTMLRSRGRDGDAARVLRSALTWGFFATVLVAAVTALTAAVWVPWMYPGFEGDVLRDTVSLTRLMSPYLVLVTVAAILAAALRGTGRFAEPAYASVCFNAGVIGGVLAAPRYGLAAVGWGVLFGGVGQIAVNFAPLATKAKRAARGVSLRPLFATGDPGMRRTWSAAPRIAADVTVSRMSTIVDMMIVSTLAAGSVSTLFYALVLFQLPFALLSQSINTVVLREMSRKLVEDTRAGRDLVLSGVRWTLLLLLPASALMVVLARPIVELLLGWGAFRGADVQAVSAALACYAVGLVGWGLHALAGRIYAARLELDDALKTNAVGVVINIVLSLTFVAAGMSFAGVALGTSLAFLIGGAFRLWHVGRNMHRDGIGLRLADIKGDAVRLGASAMAAAMIALLVRIVLEPFSAAPLFLTRFLTVVVPGTVGVSAYLVFATVSGSTELRRLFGRVGRLLDRPSATTAGRPPLNVYCLRPEQLLAAARRHPEAVRSANLTRRVRELLDRPSWKQKNIGVKLVGLLRIVPLKYDIVRIIKDRTPAPLVHRLCGGDWVNPGFVRRNAVTSLQEIESCDESVEDALLTALDDRYYEVRSAAARALTHYARELTPQARERAQVALRQRLREKNFEVATAAVTALQAVALDDSVLEVFESLHYHANWKVRNAVVRAYFDLYKRGIVEDRTDLVRRLDDVLVTCDDFLPTFELKETLRVVRNGLVSESTAAPNSESMETSA